jgi:hypothetical protein
MCSGLGIDPTADRATTMLTREDFQNVPEAQYEALLAVNAT